MSQERLPIFPKKILPIPHNDTTLSFALEAIKQKESSMLSSSRKKKRNTFSVEIRRHPCGSPTSSPPTKKRSLGDGVIQTTTPNSHAATTNKMDWQSPDSNHAGVALPNSGSFASMLGLDFTPLFSNNTASPRPSMGGGSMTGAACDALLQCYREAKTNEEATYDMIQKEEQKERQAQALLQLTQSLLNDDLTWRNDDNASVRHRLNLREDKDLARMSFTDSILALHAMDLLQVHECEWFQYGTIQTAKGDASKADMRARIGNYLNISSSAVIASQLSDEDIKSPAEDTKPPVEDTKPPAKDSKPVCGLDSMNPSDVGNTMQMHPMMHPYFHTGQPIAYPHTAMGVPFVPFGTSSMMAGGYGHMVPAAWSINGDAEFRPQTLFGMMQGTAGTSKHKQKSKKSKAGVKKAPNKAASKKAVRKEAESSFSDSSKEEKRDEEKQIDGYEGERDDSSSSS